MTPVVELIAARKHYGAVEALRGVHLCIRPGEAAALLDPNGAGKTTTISLMLGLRRPTSGSARLFGLDPTNRRARSRAGVMLQESGVMGVLTVRETVRLFRSYYPCPLPLVEILTLAGLEEVADRRVMRLSGGQRQRLYFALAICGDPEVLFLDEPTVGMDVEARRAFLAGMRTASSAGKTIVLTTHYLEEADALAERIVVIDHGVVIADTSPRELKARVASKRVSFSVAGHRGRSGRCLPGADTPRGGAMRRAVGAPAVAPFGRMLLMQTWSRLLWFWRIPAWTVSSLAMPVFFFTFFGLRFAHLTDAGGFSVGSYFLASFGAYAVGQVMVFSFGIGVSTERMLKQDLLMRATPLPPLVHLLARSLSALLFALVALTGLIVYGVIVGGIREDLSVWATVVVRLLAGSLPFIALGFAIGYLAGNAAPAVANLVYVPLSFASGLFIPVSQLPSFAKQVEPYLPTYHYGQLAWGAVGAPSEPVTTSLAWLAAYMVLFLGLAVRAYRREEEQKFG